MELGRRTYQEIRPIFLLLMGAFIAASMGGCATSGDIRSDYDHDANFGAYRTFDFIDDAGRSTGSYQSLFSKYMIHAITIEMLKRGYTKSSNPDLLVNFSGVLEEKTKVTTTPAGPSMTGYYGYRRGYYAGWGSYNYATETHVSQYTQGTFNIDLVDSERKQLVWEAVGVSRVSQKALKNLEERVQQGVPKFFEFYPFQAGDPNPAPQN